MFMRTLCTIIEHKASLINYAGQYIAGLNDNIRMQVDVASTARIKIQMMTCAVQTRNLNDAISAVARIEKKNAATIALIAQ